MRFYAVLIILAVIGGCGYGVYLYYKDTQQRIATLRENAVKLKILGSGNIKDKINIEADLASKSAIEKLEKIGGSIQLKK